jgi:hypothetical protein
MRDVGIQSITTDWLWNLQRSPVTGIVSDERIKLPFRNA